LTVTGEGNSICFLFLDGSIVIRKLYWKEKRIYFTRETANLLYAEDKYVILNKRNCEVV